MSQPQWNWRSDWYASGDKLIGPDGFDALERKPTSKDWALTVATPQPPHQGPCLRVEVRDGDLAPRTGTSGWRAEAKRSKNPEIAGDIIVRYSWWTMFDAKYPTDPRVIGPHPHEDRPPWQLFAQWHQDEASKGSSGSPPIELTIEAGALFLSTNKPNPLGDDPATVQAAPPSKFGLLDPGTWHKITVFVKWGRAGWVTAIQDDDIANAATAEVPTLYPLLAEPESDGTAYFKMGLYREAAPTRDDATAEKLGVETGGRVGYIVHHDEIERAILDGPPTWAP